MLAAEHHALVKKLILVGCPDFEEAGSDRILKNRMERLALPERAEARALMLALEQPLLKDKDGAFARLGALFSKADAFDPIDEADDPVICRYGIFKNVWQEASDWRARGKLLDMAGRIRCPVVAVHGDADPHPAEGVRRALSKRLNNFRFILLDRCGHKPWIERHAKERFDRILQEEMSGSG
jgi:pimeloyl-ACP methyl ester carboxylesterase